jgi:hypothetical protein
LIIRVFTRHIKSMTTSLLRSLIRETLLLEEVYGAQAVVYHGTKADPQLLVSALLNDEFVPGRGAGSMYGKGLYTVYDFEKTKTSSGEYGDHVIKLKLNLYGYIIFDPEIALKVYKAPLSIVEQAQEVGVDEEIIEKLRGVKIDPSNFTSVAADFASKFLKGRVKGLIYTGSRDGRCALVYDPTTAVPIAWKNVKNKKDKNWIPVDRESIKPSLRRSASGDWQEEKYEINPARAIEKLNMLPEDQRVVKGDLILIDARATSLPAGLKVGGRLDLSYSSIKELPIDLEVGKDLILRGTSITSLPEGLKVGGNFVITGTSISTIPSGLKVGGTLNLSYTFIKNLPADLKVGGSLDIRDTSITSLPKGLKVGGALFLFRTEIDLLPDDLQIGDLIYNFRGNMSKVPQHLREKIAR